MASSSAPGVPARSPSWFPSRLIMAGCTVYCGMELGKYALRRLIKGRKSEAPAAAAACAAKPKAEFADGLANADQFNDPKKLGVVFLSRFDALADQFVCYARERYGMSDSATARISHMLKYTCIGGKYNRGIGVITTVRDLCKVRHLNFSERVEGAIVLGWCIEILQACFLVADDIMDGSTTRRGQPCWYLVPETKLDAINDTLILESFIYFLLKKYFGSHPEYVQLLELYHEVSFQTQMGQMLDLCAQPQGRKDPEVLRGFNLTLYKQIVHYKTAFYTFYLPFASGMILCGLSSPAELRVAYDMSVELGEKFQIEDDYLDCYGDPALLGKVGTDIQDHKCSWLLVQALERATPEQRAVLEANLGKSDERSVQAVKDLYKQMDLEKVYLRQEEESYARIAAKIKESDAVVPGVLFQQWLDKIHLRQK